MRREGHVARIETEERLEAWLEDRPHEWAVVISARCALRVLPLLDGLREVRRERQEFRV